MFVAGASRSLRLLFGGVARAALMATLSIASAAPVVEPQAADSQADERMCPKYFLYGLRGSSPDDLGLGGPGSAFSEAFQRGLA